ncbi:MAG TPA: DnaJ domain-containing protein [Chitinophagaceae bacterium]|nr:DnaJ domain-containing protein [Chitinophagaceae bacterium]
MHLKDYYSILEIGTSATLPEIKKAYRRLAQQYHPDKKQNDPYAAALFAEIKEAYEVLTNPGKKEYYLQQRWYQHSTGSRVKQAIVSPVNILKQLLELDRYVSFLDVHRMDKLSLTEYILEILSDPSIQQLKTFNEPAISQQIILLLVKQISLLRIEQAERIAQQLYKLSNDDETNQYISATLQQYRKKEQLEKYQPWIIGGAALLIAFLIWLLSR